MLKLDQIVRAGLSRVDTIIVKRTALNAALWIVGLISPLSLILAAFTPMEAWRPVFFWFAGCPLFFACAVFLYFMVRDPDRLQSEEYRIKQQALKYLYKKGGSAEIVDVANEVPRLESERPRSHHELTDRGEKK